MFAYSANGREGALEKWLDALQSRVPGSVVLLVGTHGDLFSTILERRMQMELFQKGVYRWVSCARGTLVGRWTYGGCLSCGLRKRSYVVRIGGTCLRYFSRN